MPLNNTCNFFTSVCIYTVVYNVLLATVTIGNIKQEIAVCLLLSLSLDSWLFGIPCDL